MKTFIAIIFVMGLFNGQRIMSYAEYEGVPPILTYEDCMERKNNLDAAVKIELGKMGVKDVEIHSLCVEVSSK